MGKRPAATIAKPKPAMPRGKAKSAPAQPAPTVASDGRSFAAKSGPFQARIDRLRLVVHREGLEALLVTNPMDVAYLTGFLGGDSYMVIEGPSGSPKPTLISDSRYEEELTPVKDLARLFIRKGPVSKAVVDVIGGLKVGRFGVQSEHITLGEFGGLASTFGPHRVISTTGLISKLRVIKDETEIALITRAIQIQEEALKVVLRRVKAGQTELEVGAMLEAEMKTRGSSDRSFVSIIAARANGSLPHYRPAETTLAANQPLLIDWGAVWKGYRGDMTRTFALGKWPARIKEIYKIVLEAHEKSAAELAPGKNTFEIDQTARRVITDAGYGPRFGHGLGHGIGLNGHEAPSLSHMAAPQRLEPGMVVTIEPGIYLPGEGGVRIEDDYLITETGSVNLCTLPKDLDWATL